ncbi:MAG: hypothetical protein EBR82_33495 [Caulobacteraceae bacterium]|nr:hypothetical protein [Caulobacteraceae bacterium]
MTAESRIEEIVQAYEELTGRPSGARVRFVGGSWSGEVYPARDRNHPHAIRASADSLDTVIAAMGVAVLAMAKAEGVR